ncbi:MAG: FHA domain-containing protein [Comamonadaceae bacterium]|nr:MAG: FHA domain-containing protein [Comamonadaceae bacterium]
MNGARLLAILRNRLTAQKINLRHHHVFGRGRSVDTLLVHLDASQLHASIWWTDTRWALRDHSRNGTLLDGQRLIKNQAVDLSVGSVIGFGRDGSGDWVVEDLAAPSNLLWPIGHDSPPIALGHSNVLTSEQGDEAFIYGNENGQWIYTSPQGGWVLEDGDELQWDGKVWCFIMASQASVTIEVLAGHPTARPSTQTLLLFKVSQDEEHVWLELQDADLQLDLGERIHHYALLTLARLRLADATHQFDNQAQGWVELDQLAKMLGMDSAHLNIQIFRLRKQLAQAMPAGVAVPELIERRRGSLRFGHLRFRITRGLQLESFFDPACAVYPDRLDDP